MRIRDARDGDVASTQTTSGPEAASPTPSSKPDPSASASSVSGRSSVSQAKASAVRTASCCGSNTNIEAVAHASSEKSSVTAS